MLIRHRRDKYRVLPGSKAARKERAGSRRLRRSVDRAARWITAQYVIGVVLQLTDETMRASTCEQDRLVASKSHPDDSRDEVEDEEGDEEEDEEVKVMEQIASFDGIAVWGHELVPSDEENPYQRAIIEWATFAGKVRCNKGHWLSMADVTRRYIPTTWTIQKSL